jgi:hypothetical protein
MHIMNLDTITLWETIEHSSEYETACFERYKQNPKLGDYKVIDNLDLGNYNWLDMIDHTRSLARSKGSQDLKNAIAEKYQSIGYNDDNSRMACISDTGFPNIFEDFARRAGLHHWWYRIQVQEVGKTFPAHVDSLRSWSLEFPEAAKTNTHLDVKRFQIFGTDQEVGHFMSVGSAQLSWRAGDVIQFDHRIPHAAANSGFTPKVLAVIEGV